MTSAKRCRLILLGFAAAGLLAGCLNGSTGGSGAASGPSGRSASGQLRLPFWHTRRGAQEKTLQAICADYTKQNPGVTVEPAYQGSYNDLNKKVRGAIEAKSLPALAVAYESHVSEYMARGVVRPLDDLVSDPQIGLSKQELADIPEQYVASNRFPQYGNRLLSFPFTKSNLVMYYNRSLLKKAGFDAPPATWTDFEKQAEAVTRQLGKPAWAFTVDASTLDGLIYSQGGEVLAPDRTHTLFDQPAAVKTLELLQGMVGRKTMVVTLSGDDAGSLFAGQGCAFDLDSSSGRSTLEERAGSSFDWDVAVIPHADGAKPTTVMYGPNVCVFKAAPEQEREAWKFVKYFTSPPVTARWARESGYLPVRKSAVELPEMKAFYQQHPRALHVYQILPMARSEPNVLGWQEVRKELEDAARKVTGSGAPPQAVAAALKQKADHTLEQSK